ncbi:uncharacterized protein B0P05DRAFT_185312 [Gilbertella persicaria]|uniref:uncharacterized protein n=1 Tax=Gilbertella persicaria TaxID=101096 RepID=UPI0022203731|nr:uncharacterized protein B0P05DRAFT_185312 [Gilbertella persicaria]KAI8070603.1 hypothetical protein B0P05DRAFT_185312 [Gilbertella persicaria]
MPIKIIIIIKYFFSSFFLLYIYIYMNRFIRSYSTKVAVDKQCIPLKPTWSIQYLLEPIGEPISDKQFEHLLSLARLNITNKERKSKLKSDIDALTQFTEHIKKLDIQQEPLTHIWKEDMSQILRSDDEVKQQLGRDLLKHAKRKSGNFYTVQGSMPQI